MRFVTWGRKTWISAFERASILSFLERRRNTNHHNLGRGGDGLLDPRGLPVEEELGLRQRRDNGREEMGQALVDVQLDGDAVGLEALGPGDALVAQGVGTGDLDDWVEGESFISTRGGSMPLGWVDEKREYGREWEREEERGREMERQRKERQRGQRGKCHVQAGGRPLHESTSSGEWRQSGLGSGSYASRKVSMRSELTTEAS